MEPLLTGYQILAPLHDGPRYQIFRARRLRDGLPVILKVARAAEDLAARRAALRHEHQLLRAVADVPGVVRALDLLTDEAGPPALVLADAGLTALSALDLGAGAPAPRVLRLALSLCDTLDGLHRRRVLHKDINPANLVVDAQRFAAGADAGVTVIDLGIASQLPREAAPFISPRGLEGTLAYMSPEQTGRMNRPIDYRSDYYSLGATLYELLSGRRPFPGDDPLELVHCHVARVPPSLRERGVPAPVAAVVAKLLSKSADDRYQSIHGLRADLLRCLELVDRGADPDAPLDVGQHDVPERFRLPQRLYGRDEVVAHLAAALDTAHGRSAAVVTLSGPAGIGKTAVVQELFQPLTARRGRFIAGKFEHDRRTAYGAIGPALRALAELLLTEDDERLGRLRTRLCAALPGGAGPLIDLCPPLSLLLPPQPAAAVLPPAEAQTRLARQIGALLLSCASPDEPLCLFLDDLQWADLDSLRLLEDVVPATPGLLLLLSYRDGEVDDGHPLRVTLRRLGELGVPIEPLSVGPLPLPQIAALVGDALYRPAQEVLPLAELVLARTAGNPFFVRAFLGALHDAGVFCREPPAGWGFDLVRARELGVTDNVVDLLAGRVRELPASTQAALQRAACLGSAFELDALAGVLGEPDSDDSQDVGRALWPAVEAELLLLRGAPRVRTAADLRPGCGARLGFAHDRILEAVLATVPADRRALLHRDVGRRLLGRIDGAGREQDLSAAVQQLNLGPPPEGAAEAEERARLNLRAAERALLSAPRLALHHARAGIQDLGAAAAGADVDLAWALHRCAAEAAAACGEAALLAVLCQGARAHARDVLDQARVGVIEARQRYAEHRLPEAQAAYLEVLSRLGVELPAAPTPVEIGAAMMAAAEALGPDPAGRLRALPPCVDPEELLIFDVLGGLLAVAFTSVSPMIPVVVCQLVQRTARAGYGPHSAMGVTFYGVFRTQGGDPAGAAVLGRLALDFARRGGDLASLSHVTMYVYLYLLHPEVTPAEQIAAFESAYRDGLESGNAARACETAMTLCMARLLTGAELGALSADMGRHADQMQRLGYTTVRTYLQIYLQAVENLRAPTGAQAALVGPHFDESARMPELQAAMDIGALFNHAFSKVLLGCLLGDGRTALDAARAGAPFLAVAAGSSSEAPFVFLCGLSRVLGAEEEPAAARPALWQEVAAAAARLEGGAGAARGRHRAALLRAELLAAGPLDGESGRDAALAAYEQAVALSRDQAPIHERALVCERAGRFLLRAGKPRLSQPHLREAHAAYIRWGGLAPARALEERYPSLLPRVALSSLGTRMVSATSTGERDLGVLDLISVLDAAQALSREIRLDRLLQQLMEILLTASGAEVGYLLLHEDGRFVVQAEGGVDLAEPVVLQGVPLEQLSARPRGVAAAVVNYVARARETVLLDDARGSRFAADPHVAAARTRSLLCIPLLRQAGVLGVLYLENNLLAGAFTPSQVRVLELLSSQAATALHNAQLYDTLEQKVALRTRELAARNDELSTALSSLREAQDRLIYQDRLATLGTMVAGVAHELRNPLNFVTNFAELSAALLPDLDEELRALGVPPETEGVADLLSDLRGNLQRIREHGRRMDGVVTSMLEHARGGHGEARAVALNELVRDAVGLAEISARARQPGLPFAVELALDPGCGTVTLVPQEIHRVLLNLIDNACHALGQAAARAPAGYAPRVTVSTRDRGARVEIRVRDNGTGIPAAQRARIFEPFFTTKRAGEGTGLGLSISRDIVVRGGGGALEVDSQEGVFTEFTITLPRTMSGAVATLP